MLNTLHFLIKTLKHNTQFQTLPVDLTGYLCVPSVFQTGNDHSLKSACE